MPDRLQKKFISISAVVLLTVTVLLLLTINVEVNNTAKTRADEILHFVTLYGSDPASADEALETRDARILARACGMTPQTALETSSYFTAKAVSDGPASIEMDRVTELDESEAKALVEAARTLGEKSGRVGRFQFLRTDEDDGAATYAFLDVSESVLQSVKLTTASFGAGAVAAGVFLIYIWGAVMGVVRPLERRTSHGARLLSEAAASLLEKHREPERAMHAVAENLEAGAMVLSGAGAPRRVFRLSEMLADLCAGAAPAVEAAGAVLEEDLQSGVYIKGYPDEIDSMCRLLLNAAVRDVRSGGTVNVDLLADEKNVGLIVRSMTKPWEEGSEPFGEELSAVRLLAANNDGKAVFEAIAPDTLCCTVRFRASRPRR